MRVECFIDDYRLLRFKLYKPVDPACVQTWQLFCDDKAVNCQFQIAKESDSAYLVEAKLEDDCRYGEVYRLAWKEAKSSDLHYSLPAKWRHIVSTERFDQHYFYQGQDLGPQYTKKMTTFKVWAPTANQVSLHILGQAKDIMQPDYSLKCQPGTKGKLCDEFYPMERGHKGVYTVTVHGDLDQIAYVYELNFDGEHKSAIDPYSYASLRDAEASVVVNPAKFLHKVYKPKTVCKSNVDAVVYELSVRDLTMHSSSDVKEKGKFLGLTETGTNIFGRPTGLDYLTSLGITHVQLMPVLDFDSYPEADYYSSYNWGYDPKQYNVVEGSFLSEDTPYNRVNELRHVVDVLHQHDLRVNLDVVFNHVGHADDYALEKLVPYYPFRYFDTEYLSNGSFCGNEIRSEAKMLRKYIVDMCVRYVQIFDIDGLRFDLMGLLDITTMNEIAYTLKQLKPNFMIYGEGWNMPTVLADNMKAMMYHNYKMPDIGFFNDAFRDTIKGKTSMDAICDCGYCLGNLGKVQLAKDLLLGSCLDGRLRSCSQSINYLECHDNMTFFDKLQHCQAASDAFECKQRVKLGLALTILAQGVPFIHCGQEFMRSKGGADNTYNAGDKLNAINWYDTIKQHDVVDYCRALIKLRRENPEFRLKSPAQIAKACSFEDFYDILLYKINDLTVYINPTPYDYKYQLKRKARILLADKMQLHNNEVEGELKIAAMSIVVTRNL